MARKHMLLKPRSAHNKASGAPSILDRFGAAVLGVPKNAGPVIDSPL
jgi:hypothetical protein